MSPPRARASSVDAGSRPGRDGHDVGAGVLGGDLGPHRLRVVHEVGLGEHDRGLGAGVPRLGGGALDAAGLHRAVQVRGRPAPGRGWRPAPARPPPRDRPGAARPRRSSTAATSSSTTTTQSPTTGVPTRSARVRAAWTPSARATCTHPRSWRTTRPGTPSGAASASTSAWRELVPAQLEESRPVAQRCASSRWRASPWRTMRQVPSSRSRSASSASVAQRMALDSWLPLRRAPRAGPARGSGRRGGGAGPSSGGCDLVDVDVDGDGEHPQAVDAGLLGSLPEGDRRPGWRRRRSARRAGASGPACGGGARRPVRPRRRPRGPSR